MSVGTLSPAYVQLNYHSIYGAHVALIPTKEWFPTSLTGHLGSYSNWLSIPCDAEAMIQDYADAMMAFYPSTAGTDTATIWTKATPTSPAYPRAQYPITSPGTLSMPGWSKAVQHQYILRGTDFSLMKLLFLDCPIGGSWDALSDISGSAEAIAVVGAITSDSWAWQTRKDAQPFSFVKITYKLNDKLRDQYSMN